MKTSSGNGQSKFPAPMRIDFDSGSMGQDTRIERICKTIGAMAQVFENEEARQKIDSATVVYEVESWRPVAEGLEGGLFCGNSTVFPGLVGDEYFMTRGHFHVKRDRAEFYATIAGTGLLLIMDEQRRTIVQEMTPGSTHYIPGHTAHRVINTGEEPLRFLACWPSDAGHDYATIDEQGFSVRVMRRNGRPQIVNQG
ncbi:MAG: glucose-6-phosphate isomerase family protein [Terracidiphilus sp.]